LHVLGQTFLVIAQDFKDATVGNAVGAALANHSSKFDPERLKPGDARLDRAKLFLSDCIDLRA
jgi:hypothetical protein